MKIKNQKGITGIDITIAILVITLFVSLLITLFNNLNANSAAIQRRTEATKIAISIIENVKSKEFSEYELKGTLGTYEDSIEYEDGTYEVIDRGNIEENSAFYKTIAIIDYSNMKENLENKNIVPNLVKKITVEISYKDRNKTESVKLSAILNSRE